MFKSIKTSENNKKVVSNLTNKWNLGTENIIARFAISYSLYHSGTMHLDEIQDSKGKEYSRRVLLGSNEIVYWALLSKRYNLPIQDKNLARYLKLHLDDGLLKLSLDEPKFNGNHFLSNIVNTMSF